MHGTRPVLHHVFVLRTTRRLLGAIGAAESHLSMCLAKIALRMAITASGMVHSRGHGIVGLARCLRERPFAGQW
jgi:hypothetical protein